MHVGLSEGITPLSGPIRPKPPRDADQRDHALDADPRLPVGWTVGGILWNEFRSYSEAHPGDAARVLSYLFDEETNVTIRLDRFGQFYDSLETTGGPLMSLATMLLTFVYPTSTCSTSTAA